MEDNESKSPDEINPAAPTTSPEPPAPPTPNQEITMSTPTPETHQAAPPQPPPPPAIAAEMTKSPGLAAFLSVILPGLGNIYNGLYMRGGALFLIWASVFGLVQDSAQHGHEADMGFLIPCMIFIWAFNVFDAFRQAKLINHGYATDLGLTERPKLGVGGGGMAIGVALVVIGLYGALRRYLDFDLSWLLQHWPLFLIAFGGWMVWQAIQARREEAVEEF